MASKYPYMLNRKGHYYFRIAVPHQLLKFLEVRELTYSLSTTCRIEAQARSLMMHQAVLELFVRVPIMATTTNVHDLTGAVHGYMKQVKRQITSQLTYINDRAHRDPSLDVSKEYTRKDYLLKDLSPGQSTKAIWHVDHSEVANRILNTGNIRLNQNSPEYLRLMHNVPEIVQNLEQQYQQEAYSLDLRESFSQHWDAYKLQMKTEGLKERTILDKDASLSLWLLVVGDVPLAELGKSHVRSFKDMLMRLPSNHTKLYSNIDLTDLVNLDMPKEICIKPRTIKGYMSDLSGYVKWMIHNGFFEKANPFDGMSVKDNVNKRDKRDPFTESELVKIVQSPIFQGCQGTNQYQRYASGTVMIKDSFFWAILIGLYSGARLNEILQLDISDIKLIDGFWFFDINDDGEHKSVKNKPSRRIIPIHSKILKAGFLDYLQALKTKGQSRVFYDCPRCKHGTYSNIFSKRFGYFLKSKGIKRAKISFHSLRHTVMDRLRIAVVQRDVSDAITGHSDGSTRNDYGSGGRAFKAQTLNDAIESVQYPFLEPYFEGILVSSDNDTPRAMAIL